MCRIRLITNSRLYSVTQFNCIIDGYFFTFAALMACRKFVAKTKYGYSVMYWPWLRIARPPPLHVILKCHVLFCIV